MSETTLQTGKNPGCLIQLLWFAFVGWWLTEMWISVAWFLMVTIIGIPFGVIMINYVPFILALRGQSQDLKIVYIDGNAPVVSQPSRPQTHFLLRALYFVLIGWWFSALWMQAAYFFCLSIIGLPIGFWMFDKTPFLLSLHR